MISDSELDARKRLTLEMILESEGLTADLRDDEAEILLDWGMTQAEAYALTTQDIADEEEVRLALEQGVKTVRRAMRCINDLVAERMHLNDREMVEDLLELVSLAKELPDIQVIAGEEREEILEEEEDID